MKKQHRANANTTRSPQISWRSGTWIAALTCLGVVVLVLLVSWLPTPVQPIATSPVAADASVGATVDGGTDAGNDALSDEGALPVSSGGSWQQVDNPARDGWTTEVRADQAKHILDRLGQLLLGDDPLDPAQLEKFCTSDFAGTHLVPSHLQTRFQDDVFKVEELDAAAGSAGDLANERQGNEGFVAAARQWAAAWAPLQKKRVAFKVFRSLQDQDDLLTHQYVETSGWGDEKSVEQHATWVIHWQVPPDSDQLRIRSLELTEFQQTTARQSQPLLADCTHAALGKNDTFEPQFLYGLNYWLDRTQDMRYFSPLGNPGLAAGDVNGDGLDDLYVCQEANLPNRLFIQQADGTARESSAVWQVDWLEASRSALFVDLDNDGDQDLAVAILGGLVIASNEGNRFVVRDVLTTDDDTTSLTAADYDLDGDLDLYVCVDYPNDFFASTQEVPIQGGAANRVYHDASNAGRNSLFRNDTQRARGPNAEVKWSFVDATAEVGLEKNNLRFSWASCWDDFDNDGDQDLYVANDFGRNNLYVNDHGSFVDRAAEAEAEDSASGMSTAWGDVNRDGFMDLYISNMFSSAGGRITFQPEFKQDSDQQVKQRIQRFARGSTLLVNEAGSKFKDISVDAGVTVGRWAWSSNFVDLNNDGWQDIAVANGYITNDDTGDL